MIKLFGAGESDDYKEEIESSGELYVEEEIYDDGQVALDIIEKSDEIIILAPIAGVDLEDIDISINTNILTISGLRKRPEELYGSGYILRSDECFWGSFSRDIILPENLELESIKAILEKNILIIRLPKLKFNSQSINIEKIGD